MSQSGSMKRRTRPPFMTNWSTAYCVWSDMRLGWTIMRTEMSAGISAASVGTDLSSKSSLIWLWICQGWGICRIIGLGAPPSSGSHDMRPTTFFLGFESR
ncbi:MAG: hypothetical protein GIKADHBN_00614 [Phycisphaerales bacterium]|nr:hypothetical protein [Phycisphaerales bacterium]